jgi:SAM-dependent methyltransferase
MDRARWDSWAGAHATRADEPWLISKWETFPGVRWPEAKIALMVEDIRVKLGLGPERVRWLADIGCGTGWIGRRLMAYAEAVVGIDSAEGMLELAARKAGLALAAADAGALPFPDASLDRALIYFMLMNIAEPERVIAVMREGMRVLKPGGKLLAGQMPLASRSADYDREKARHLAYWRERGELGEDTSRDHAPPVVLFADDFGQRLARALPAPVAALPSFNHFWREGEPVQCTWRVDYLITRSAP